ncbi:unnamed protein product [Rotaria socialis]|uniref:Uncharacterized protein n=1 Tax=Rotaria socialis TaxID=392032 RepID=A0A817NE47_9BILA|nr:unnamed protein product [Rotaria socialis]CAF4652169.1 unnamed protein product [Rotaria socialis]CAF4699866.1 unnamed protein product [Rotaria socialis]CAF4929031.1 unnamed protein product [Rotaria socialis]
MFPYQGDELNSKPYLDLSSDGLKKQSNAGMPLTSMQMFYLFINLPFIVKKLLHSSNFQQYHAILICVDILSLCFATTTGWAINNDGLRISGISPPFFIRSI